MTVIDKLPLRRPIASELMAVLNRERL